MSKDEYPWTAELSIPNLDVLSAFEGMFRQWLSDGLGGTGYEPNNLTQAFLDGDAKGAERLLGHLFQASLSDHDVGGSDAEAVYQTFIVGLLVHLRPTHEVTSNRESGLGRYDVMIAPREAGKPGAVLELKLAKGSGEAAREEALDAALHQIRERKHGAALRERGADPVREMAIVFDGEEVRARAAD